jgi:serine/threonine protein kinase
MLADLAQIHHEHLVKLLATYKLKGQYYLLFPFANANLRDYWSSVPEPHWNKETYHWFLDQVIGLASGLNVIHNFSTSNRPLRGETGNAGLSRRRPSAANQRLDVLLGEEMYGRHGDLKPENILCSNEPPGSYSSPILQITDLGLGRFHRLGSRSRDDPKKVMGSATYTPPEISLEIPVSRAYDIWSLGCIFLEFTTWLMEGSAAILEFSNARNETALDEIDDDTFFSLKTSEQRSYAEVRSGVVAWIQRLQQSERCSGMVRELLDLISQKMLQIQTKDRIGSSGLKSTLKDFLAHANRDTAYLLGNNPPVEVRGKGIRQPERTISQATFSSEIAANNPVIRIDEPTST